MSGTWIYRRPRAGTYSRPLGAAPLAGGAYLDATATAGETWCYAGRTVASLSPLVESADSTEACVEVRDDTPPAAPRGLAAILRDTGVELSWTPSTEPDLAFYRVYRALGSGAPERLADVPAGQTTFRPPPPADGVPAVYTVRAVDRVGNESAPSNQAEAPLP